ATAFWYALGPGARAQIERHLRRYLNWLDPREVEALLPTTGFAGSPAELRAMLRRIEDAGAEEVVLVPTTADPDEVSRAADCIGWGAWRTRSSGSCGRTPRSWGSPGTARRRSCGASSRRAADGASARSSGVTLRLGSSSSTAARRTRIPGTAWRSRST